MSPRALALTLGLLALACGGSQPSSACGGDSRLALAVCGAGLPPPPAVATRGARTVFSPEALRSGAVEVALAEGERVAVFVLNARGRDGAVAALRTVGVAAPPSTALRAAVSAPPRALPPGDAGVLVATRGLGPILAGTSRAALSVAPAATPPAQTSFCVLRSADSTASGRRPARLAAQTDHALVYVDASTSDVSAAEAAQLADAFERRIHPALTGVLGAPSDVDGDGRITLFLTPLPQLWGYYWATDVLLARDATADCSGTRSNAADAIYLTLPSSVTAAGWSRAEAIAQVLPGVAAHEFTHLLSFQRRCLARTCVAPEETWIEEGLAKIGEDEAGFGWNVERSGGIDYLTRTHEDAYRGYDGRSLTRWEGDSVGNYEGAHAFFRYHADRLGPDILASLTSGATGTANVERALGVSLPEALADVATALFFSNSAATPAPEYSFTGAGWTPLRDKLRLLDAAPLGPAGASATLRTDGWNAFVTGPAGAAGGVVRVESSEAVKPWVAVVRFRGEP